MDNVVSPARNDRSPTIGKLAEALAKAQGDIQPAKKDASNPFFNSRYADLAAVWDSARAALTANGLSIVQTTSISGGDVTLLTTMLHTSGEWISGEYPIRPQQATPQGFGSAMTYARRYAFCAIAGVVAEGEDDDGNDATVKPGVQSTSDHPSHQAALNRPLPPAAPPEWLSNPDSCMILKNLNAVSPQLDDKGRAFLNEQVEKQVQKGAKYQLSVKQAGWARKMIEEGRKKAGPTASVTPDMPSHLNDQIPY